MDARLPGPDPTLAGRCYSRDLKRGTLAAIIEQAGLTVDGFLELL
jgi:hypothetical protein